VADRAAAARRAVVTRFPPPYPPPRTLAEWRRRRTRTRRVLRHLLGPLPPRPRPVAATLGRRRVEADYVREDLVLDNGAGARVPAALVLPRAGRPPHPALLYHHSHFGDYAVGLEELFQPWPVRETPAVALARRGWAVLAIDAYAFGGRRGRGPGGARETGRAEETSLAKLFLWQGTSLWAMMVRDDLVALDYLAHRPEVDARRLGATGMSMGSTRAWWLAALDARVAATVAVGCLTRYADLVRAGALARHGIYYYVPGLLRRFDTEAVLGLIAPRPLLTLTGGRDPGSPLTGVRTLNRFCARVWALHGAPEAFAGVVHPRLGHAYTRAMWARMVAWFARHL
jgi:dienelactone hydrolase